MVVKFEGSVGGITATGRPLDIDDRIGGAVQVVGQPGYPVYLTSINDCSVGAGFTPEGFAQIDTVICSLEDDEEPAPVGNSGAVVLDGGDRDDHGSTSAGPDGIPGTPDDENSDGWLYIEQLIEFAYNGSRLTAAPNDILAVGVDPGVQPAEHWKRQQPRRT